MKITKTKATIIGLIILAAIAGGSWFAWYKHRAAALHTPGLQQVNLNPPSQQEKSAVDQHKEDLTKGGASTPPSKTTSGKLAVTPVITDASQYGDTVEVRAYVAGVVEAGGTCSVTFVHGSSTITRQVGGLQDATTTRCTNLSVPRSQFPSSGSWSVTVSYSSSTAEGSSAQKTVEIQ